MNTTLTPAALITALVALGASLNVTTCAAAHAASHTHTLTLGHLSVEICSYEQGRVATWSDTYVVINDATDERFVASAEDILDGFRCALNARLETART